MRFSVTEPDGSASTLDPYMGMLGHAAVLRDDGSVFVHLHPAGSINLTAQRRVAEAEGAGAGGARRRPAIRTRRGRAHRKARPCRAAGTADPRMLHRYRPIR